MPNSPRFLLDENIPVEVKEFLRSRTLSAEYASKGIFNSKIASLAKERGAVLLSRDIDFLNTSLFPPREFSGIVVFRIHPPKAEKLVESLSLLLQEVKDFKAKVFVVKEDGFKVIED